MTWYTETDKQEVDYSKPICADSAQGTTYLLLPTNHGDSYRFRGYDWFNPVTGTWNSSVNWKTAEEACSSYCNVRNCSLKLWEY